MTRFLRGQPPPRMPLLVPPVGVVQRQSTNWLSVADPAVAAVLRFIHDHAHEPLTVARLLPVAALSRRLLERRFRVCMGRSMLEEIHRVKLDRVRERLVHSDHTLDQIAAACGFSQLSHLSALFRRKTGQTLSDCRAMLRRGRRFSRQRASNPAY